MGNLPKREGHLLQSEPQRTFCRRPQVASVSPPCGSATEHSPEDGLRGRRCEVSLDGAETKSEDCQVDAGTYVAPL